MPFTFVDRVPSKLGRVRISPENGGSPYYAVVERADEPAVAGTPLSAKNLNDAQETLVYQNTTNLHTFKRVYLATNGNDNNTGATASTPMATIKAAIRKYAKWHKYIDLYLADGTYTENIGTISTDSCTISIRSASEDKDKVTISSSTMLETHINQFRLYNITLTMTAVEERALSVNAGQFYAYNTRFNMPTTSGAATVNVYNGASAFLSECVINAGTVAAVYGNQALLIRAYRCTSERKIEVAFQANNGSTIEYDETINATTMIREVNGGKCIRLADRAGRVRGSMNNLYGRYLTSDGLLMQWGTVDITPSGVNVPTSAVLEFPIKYEQTPLVFCTVVTSVPEKCAVSVLRNTVADNKAAVEIILTRNGVTETNINWFAIGTGAVAT